LISTIVWWGFITDIQNDYSDEQFYVDRVHVSCEGELSRIAGLEYNLMESSTDGADTAVTTTIQDVYTDVFSGGVFSGKYQPNNVAITSSANITYSAGNNTLPSFAVDVSYEYDGVESTIMECIDLANGNVDLSVAEEFVFGVDNAKAMYTNQRSTSILDTYDVGDYSTKTDFVSYSDDLAPDGLVAVDSDLLGIKNKLIVNHVVYPSTQYSTEETASQTAHKQRIISINDDNIKLSQVDEWWDGICLKLLEPLDGYTIRLKKVTYGMAPPFFNKLDGYVKLTKDGSGTFAQMPLLSVTYSLDSSGFDITMRIGDRRPNINYKRIIDRSKNTSESTVDNSPPTVMPLQAKPTAHEVVYTKTDNPVYLGCNARDNETYVDSIDFWYAILNQTTGLWGAYVSIGAGALQTAVDSESEDYWEYNLSSGYFDFSAILTEGDIFKIKYVAKDSAGNVGTFEQELMYKNEVPQVDVSVLSSDYTNDGAPVSINVDHSGGATTFDLKFTVAKPEEVKIQGTVPSESDGVYLYYNQVALHTVDEVHTATEHYWEATGLAIPDDGKIIPAEVTVTNTFGESTTQHIYIKGTVRKPSAMAVEVRDNATTPDETTTTVAQYTDDIRVTGNFWEEGYTLKSYGGINDVILTIYDPGKVVGYNTATRTPASGGVQETIDGSHATYPVEEFNPIDGTQVASSSDSGTFGHFEVVTTNGFGLTKDKVYEMTWTIFKKEVHYDVTGTIIRVTNEYGIESPRVPFMVVNTPVTKKADDNKTLVDTHEATDIPTAKKELTDGVATITYEATDPDPPLARGAGWYQSLDGGISHTLLSISAISGVDSATFTINQNDTDETVVDLIFNGGSTNGRRGAIRFTEGTPKIEATNNYDAGTPTWTELTSANTDRISATYSTKEYRLLVDSADGSLSFVYDPSGVNTLLFEVSALGTITIHDNLVPDANETLDIGTTSTRMSTTHTKHVNATSADWAIEEHASGYGIFHGIKLGFIKDT